MKKIVTGILAHVDAGKTTLSEGLLFCSGEIRKFGRVDNRDSFLDTNEIERSRGITIFSKQAIFSCDDAEITLVDTPGHVDFVAEAERTLQVLDYAILIISASDGVQGHTKTLWDMLKKHNIPTFVFVNKMDLCERDKGSLVQHLKDELEENFVDFSDMQSEEFKENAALCDENIMNCYIESGEIKPEELVRAIALRKVFPCFFGSALNMVGVEEFLKAFAKLTRPAKEFPVFGAKVFKIGQDDKGQRLTFVKVTGKGLKVKESIKTSEIFEKVNEIRVYSGDKYKSLDFAEVGTVCALTGLANTYAGQGLGFEENSSEMISQPIFNYRVILPKGTDVSSALSKLKLLQQQETLLNVEWNEQLKEIQLTLMGEIQLEVIKQQIKKLYDLDVEFEEGRLLYKETITNIVEGVGHYEPLRHYAEVHLLLEPLPRGMGVHFATDCPEDQLDKNWQRLIMTHLMEKQHIGALTGSPITDIKITLKAGSAHLKHTEGGDFRQATYRAVRQGLRSANSILLEPYFEFVMDVPSENVGKAMTDLNLMGATFNPPINRGDMAKISGTVAAEKIRSYHRELINYTHGKGKLSCKFSGYSECKNTTEIIEKFEYSPDADVENTADSVFCSHGAGFTVKWNEVQEHMHLESVLKPRRQSAESTKTAGGSASFASDEELIKIFEKTYGKIKQRDPNKTLNTPKAHSSVPKPHKKAEARDEYMLIDGYNIIFAWDELKELAKDSLEAARMKLVERISAYKNFKQCEIIVVFDAYRVKGNIGEVETVDGITVVYTKEAQTADAYIEKTAKELSKKYNVTVATSDGLEQMIIFGSGAFRMSADMLHREVCETENTIKELVKEYNLKSDSSDFLRVIYEKMQEMEI